MIRISRADGVGRIALDNPATRNALRCDDWHALAAAANNLHGVQVVIVRSSSPTAFCAGANLNEMTALRDDRAARARFRQALRAGIDAIAALPMPVIAAIDGGCHGAGVALALAADWRIAGDGAAFATTPAKLGIGYPGQDVARLVATVGHSQAARLLLSAERIDADEAARIGLVQVRARDALAAADDAAGRIAALSGDALRMLKATIAAPEANDAAFDALFAGADFARRLAAFHARPR